MARKTALTLQTRIGDAISEKRINQADEADSAKIFAELSAEATQNSETHARHADALEQALRILEDAGVDL